MIVPNNSIAKIVICNIFAILFLYKSYKVRLMLTGVDDFSIKWRKIKSVESICALIVGILGTIVAIFPPKELFSSDLKEWVVYGIIAALCICVGIIEDSYTKAENKHFKHYKSK